MMAKAPKIAKAQGRSVTEWIGKTPDAKIPDRVLLRILRRFDHVCQLTFVKIVPGITPEFDHVKRLEDGGEHRESNLVPVMPSAHKTKSALEMGRQAKADAIAKRSYGMKEPAKPIPSPGFAKSAKTPRIEKQMPPRQGGIYAQYFEKESAR